MQANLAYRSESAWDLGDYAYDVGDTLETAIAKAREHGIKSGSNEYAAFMTAFGRRMRSKQVSPSKAAVRKEKDDEETGASASAEILTPDFSRTVS